MAGWLGDEFGLKRVLTYRWTLHRAEHEAGKVEVALGSAWRPKRAVPPRERHTAEPLRVSTVAPGNNHRVARPRLP